MHRTGRSSLIFLLTLAGMTLARPSEAALMAATAIDLGSAAAHSAPPLLRRFLVSLISLLGGIAVSVQGWDAIAGQRRLRGLSLVLAGIIIATGGLVLLGLNAHPPTWDWWL